MARNTYIFAGGGSGGHLCPGLAVAERIVARDSDALLVFACSNRPIDRTILDPTGYVIVPQPVTAIPPNPLQWWGFWRAWRQSATLAGDLVRDLQPRAVLGLGGFAAGPVVKVASRRSVPTALLNPDAIPGTANRYLAGKVDAIFTQFEPTRKAFRASDQDRVRVVGCPLRSDLSEADRVEALAYFGLRDDRRTLLIFGGSLLAASLSDAVLALDASWAEVSEDWQLLAITRESRRETMQAMLAKQKLHGAVLPYCDRMDLAYAAADLALCRSGAGTIAELTATDTPAVLMPYPHHADRQQYLNAMDFVDAGAGVVVDDDSDPISNAGALHGRLFPVLTDPGQLAEMTRAAKALPAGQAAEDVARWMLDAAPPPA